MNLLRFVLIVHMFFCLGCLANAEEPVEFMSHIDHLEPSQIKGGYTEFVVNTLLRKENERRRSGLYSSVVIKPSFSPDAILDIYMNEDKGADVCAISFVQAKKNLRVFYEQSEKKSKDVPLVNVEIEKEERPLPKDIAILVRRVWLEMLFGCKYSRGSYKGLDGCMYVFSAHKKNLGMLYGEIWSPTEGRPKELVEIVDSLIKYCREGSGEKNEILNAVKSRCEALIKKLGAEGPFDLKGKEQKKE